MHTHDLIVVGASAGGVEALTRLVASLPADLPAAILVVLHVPPHGTSVLPKILERAGSLRAVHASAAQILQRGMIYVAPPDFHMIVKPDHAVLTRGPNENGHRPAVDPLFRTAARSYGPRVIGIVLSGALDDGTAGLQAIKMRGGITIVQDPDDALYAGMPSSALEHVQIDHVVPAQAMGSLLATLTRDPAPDAGQFPMPDEMEIEAEMAELDENAVQQDDRPGVPSGYACPECGGALFEIHDGELLRFRCRVGHAFGVETLLAEQSEALDDALWVALRALEENAALSRRLAERSRSRGSLRSAERFEEQAEAAAARANVIRQVLKNGTLDLPDAKASGQ